MASNDPNSVTDAKTCKTIMRGVNQRIQTYRGKKEKFESEKRALEQKFNFTIMPNLMPVIPPEREYTPAEQGEIRKTLNKLRMIDMGLHNKARIIMEKLLEATEMGCKLEALEIEE